MVWTPLPAGPGRSLGLSLALAFLTGAVGCSLVTDFPADCRPNNCDGGLTCESDGVQCRVACSGPEHCRPGFSCDVATGACEGGPGEAGEQAEAGEATESGEGGEGGGGEVAAGEGEGEGPPGDRDADGVPDDEDHCPDIPDARNGDGDGDGVGDLCDVCPIDPDPEQPDADLDGWGDACDNCTAVPNGGDSQTDSDRDGVGNACDTCPDEPNRDQADRDGDGLGDVCDPCPDFADPTLRAEDCVSIVEPPEPNGHPGAAPLLTTPAVVRGAIGLPGSDAYAGFADVDVFLVRAPQGRILTTVIRAVGERLDPAIELRPLLRAAPAPATGQRDGEAWAQVVMDRTETWVVTVRDSAGEGARDGFEYELFLDTRRPRGQGAPMPYSEERPQPRGGDVDALRLEAGAGGGMLAVSVEAGEAAARDSGLRLIIDGNERIVGAGETEAYAWLSPGQVVHAVWGPGPGVPPLADDAEAPAVTWRARLHAAPGVPDPVDAQPAAPARPLQEGGLALDGVLSEPGGLGADRDHYSLIGGLGDGFRLTARPTGNSPAQPAMILRDLDGRVLRRTTPGPDGLTRLEGVFPADELYVVEVFDERNAGAVRQAGGDDHDYAVAWAALDVPTVQVAPPGSARIRLDRPGAVAKVAVPSTFDRWVSVTASAHGGSLVPELTVLDPGGGVLAQGLGYVTFRPPAFRAYEVIVGDALGRGGAGEAIEVITRASQLVTFAEANESDVPTPAGLATRAIQGRLDSAGAQPDTVDEFLVTSPIGAALIVHALAIPQEDRVERAPAIRVSLLDDQGQELLATAEPGGSTPPVATAVGARYVVRVQLDGAGVAGYAVVVDASVCPSPAGVPQAEDGDLALLEVLGDVGQADTNGDGLPHLTHDRFVELTAAADHPVHIGGYVLHGQAPRSVRLTCGLVAAPGRPTLLFGGGRPWGEFGGSAVWTVDELGILPESGDPVSVRDVMGGVVLDEAVGAAAAGVSRHWDGAGWASHDAILLSQGQWSPGYRPDGSSYTAGTLCSDDGDCGLTEACQAEVDPLGGTVRTLCRARTGPLAAGLPCADDAACASGVCEPPLQGGERICRGPCGDDGALNDNVCALGARCYRDEWAFRFPGGDDGTATDDRWVALAACAPDRGTGGACASFPDCDQAAQEVCVPRPTGDRLGWRNECRRPLGAEGHGALCDDNRDCRSGVCMRIPDTETSICLGACIGDGDCAFGSCRQQPLPTDDHDTPADAADDRALPLLACFP